MIKYLKDLFLPIENDKNDTSSKPGIDSKKRLQIATCALFIEIANADDNFSEDERKHIIDAMKDYFDLSEEYVNELIELSEERIQHSVSLYEFTDIINNHLTGDEKYEVIKNLWKLVLIDNELNKYEDYYIRKISNNLHMSHIDLVTAKMEVKNELNLKD